MRQAYHEAGWLFISNYNQHKGLQLYTYDFMSKDDYIFWLDWICCKKGWNK